MQGRALYAGRRELVHLLDRSANNPALYLQDAVDLLRSTLCADVGILFRTSPRPGGGLLLELCHQVGIPNEQMAVLHKAFAAGSPIAVYNPEAPEREQRNRVVSLTHDGALDTKKLRNADSYFRRYGSTVYNQHRVLICDGPLLLARVGIRRERALSASEHRVFASLIPSFQQALRMERLMRSKEAQALGLTAVLDRLEGLWFITNAIGEIEHANASALQALQTDLAQTRARVRGAIAHRHDQPGNDADVNELTSGGMPRGFLVKLRSDASLARRVELARRTWGLTARQSQALAFVAAGDSNKDIACKLQCAERTVEAHVTQLLRAAKTPARAALIAKFWTMG